MQLFSRTKSEKFAINFNGKNFHFTRFALGKSYMIDSHKNKQEKKRKIRKISEIT